MDQQSQLITPEAPRYTESPNPNPQRFEDLTSQASQLLQRASYLKLRAVARCDAGSQAPIQDAGNGIEADLTSTYPRQAFMSTEVSVTSSASSSCSEDGDHRRERVTALASTREPSPLAVVSISDTELKPRGTKNYLTAAWTDREEQVATEPALEHFVVPRDEPTAAHAQRALVTETTLLVRSLFTVHPLPSCACGSDICSGAAGGRCADSRDRHRQTGEARTDTRKNRTRVGRRRANRRACSASSC